ncbi:MAG: transposase [Methyloprofundus sp.]|nr:transposase [Methyloprofundus sp.]
MHRGNNRQDIFESEDDMLRIKEDIECSLSKSNCHLHAYVIMSNHLHLLITPSDKVQLAKFMQSMANRYVRYYNAKHQRTGTIWEGRFKSCLVDSDHYLFSLYKYIEMNPVKANMVEGVADYPWSSYRCNALGESDNLITEHKLYTCLGSNLEERYVRYKELFSELSVSQQQEEEITKATLTGEVFGSTGFHHKISLLIPRVTRLSGHGGDRKSQDYKNKAD